MKLNSNRLKYLYSKSSPIISIDLFLISSIFSFVVIIRNFIIET